MLRRRMTRKEAIAATRNTRAYTIDVITSWRSHLTNRRAEHSVEPYTQPELAHKIAVKAGITEHEVEAVLTLYPAESAS